MSTASGSGGGGAAPAPLHARSFKLRFATHREPGRSYVSPTKPLALPATVTGKFYTRVEPTRVDEKAERRALRTIQDMFQRGPREKYPSPATSAHEYGWWWEALREPAASARGDRRLHRPIRDSAWLKARARLQVP